jgi:hypothetical protein
MKWGIDVSHWQGNFNFDKAKAEGVEFAIIKAGGGDAGLYTDSKFERNYAVASSMMPVGAYFFGCAMDTNQAMKEAAYFCKIIEGKHFPMKVWYDVEAKMLKAPNLSLVVITFIERVRAAGFECGIYASESTLKTLCKNSAINNYPHWTARWTKTPPKVATEIWQFGGETNLIRSNKVAGVTCDQNYLLDNAEIVTPAPEKPTITPTPTQEDYKMMPTIKKGSKGKAVKIWQIIMGATADGVFGPITEQKTKQFQQKNGLVADGIVGPKTWQKGIATLK